MAFSHLAKLYKPGFGLLTDLYQLTMAYGYWKQGWHDRRSIFHLFFRRAPFGGRFAMASGLALAMDLVEQFRFSAEEVQYLGGLKGDDGRPLFSEAFLNYLQRLRFTGSIYGLPEGTAVFPHEPLLRVEAPLPQAQLLETALLTVMNYSTLITTKAARVVAAAGGDSVLEFGLRRAQGIDGGLTASRSAFIGGCDATSNVWAGRYYGIPVKGTHAHSWVMVFEDELTAFRAYAAAQPHNSIFLVDTYSTEEGVRNAITVAGELRDIGRSLLGIRLDSGDLDALSRMARQMLDEAGFPDVQILASNDLDEEQIARLKAAGAPITIWGVGTRLVTGHEQPALGGVYKLSAVEEADGSWGHRIKQSEQKIKINTPGRLQVRRVSGPDGVPAGSILYDTLDPPAIHSWVPNGKEQAVMPPNDHAFEDLLVPIFENGRCVYEAPSLRAVRQFCLEEQARYAQVDWESFTFGLETGLHRRKDDLLQRIRLETGP